MQCSCQVIKLSGSTAWSHIELMTGVCSFPQLNTPNQGLKVTPLWQSSFPPSKVIHGHCYSKSNWNVHSAGASSMLPKVTWRTTPVSVVVAFLINNSARSMFAKGETCNKWSILLLGTCTRRRLIFLHVGNPMLTEWYLSCLMLVTNPPLPFLHAKPAHSQQWKRQAVWN